MQSRSSWGIYLLFLELMQHIKIINDLCPSDRILVCDKIGVNPPQKDCFIQKRVLVVRVVMEVEGLLFVSHYYLWGVWIDSKL